MEFRLMTHIDRINYFSDGFIEYYKKFFHLEEFYFLIHSHNYKKIVEYLYSHGFDESQMCKYNNFNYLGGEKNIKQNSKKKEFIKEGYTVVYSSQDERIVHPDLRNYIIKNLNQYMVPRGVVIIHHSSEPELDVTKPLLSQRNYQVGGIKGRCKPQILNKNICWDSGMHLIPDNATVDENIYLVDIGKCCVGIALENNINSLTIYNNLANYYNVTDKQNIRKLFNRKAFKKIPEELKKVPTLF